MRPASSRSWRIQHSENPLSHQHIGVQVPIAVPTRSWQISLHESPIDLIHMPRTLYFYSWHTSLYLADVGIVILFDLRTPDTITGTGTLDGRLGKPFPKSPSSKPLPHFYPLLSPSIPGSLRSFMVTYGHSGSVRNPEYSPESLTLVGLVRTSLLITLVCFK